MSGDILPFEPRHLRPPEQSRFVGVITTECDCFCDHVEPCENGCHAAGDDPEFEWDSWTCVGGTMYKLHDTREG